MSVAHPRNLAEWRAHFETLDGPTLYAKAKAANAAGFVRTLQAEGYRGEQIEALFILLARRLRDLGQPLPSDGYFDLGELVTEEIPPDVW